MDNLPQSVRDMIDLVGLNPALALVRAYPGICIKVPTGAREDGLMRYRLIHIMGAEAAKKVIANYGGERITVPRCVEAIRDARDIKIIEDYTDGRSVPELAIDNCLTERQIRTILNRVPGDRVNGLRPQTKDYKQLGLF